MLAMARECLGDDAHDGAWLASIRPGRSEQEQMLESLAGLYVRGVDPSWEEFYRKRGHRKTVAPTYAFQRESYWSAPLRGAARPSPSRAAPVRPSLRTELLAQDHAARIARLQVMVRRLAADALGRSSENVSDDEDLLDAGLDSLRVTEIVAALARRAGIACSAADFAAHPTVARFSAQLAAKLANPDRSNGTSPLVALRSTGSRSPLWCFHASGGEVTAYLRLRTLFGDDVPLYALRSRAVGEPEREHESVAAMAADYAAVIASAHPGPHWLLGWSMGGVVAHATAAELERAGTSVERVVLIDSPVPEAVSDAHCRALALSGVVYDLSPSPKPELIRKALRIADDALLGWCEEQELLPRGAISANDLAASLALRSRHIRMVAAHHPPTISAPLSCWWADMPSSSRGWDEHTRAPVTAHELDATHFTIMSEACLQVVAADLRRQMELS
jgi:thioesterase domain-containing protein/aryl carrier-like protein